MTRIVSFVVLVAILLVIAGVFLRVMANFLLPMFLAVLLVVMFGPLHRWFVAKCSAHRRLAAGLTTASILLILLVPFLAILVPAIHEGKAIYDGMLEGVRQSGAPRADGIGPTDAAGGAVVMEEPSAASDVMALQKVAARKLADLGGRFNLNLTPQDIQEAIGNKLREWLAPIATNVARFTGNLLIGFGVMIISLYYFLADGPSMIRTAMRLSPLDTRYEEQLLEQFDNITRAVVVATLLSAFVQGLLAGLGFYVAGLGPVFLLTLLTMLLAMVPFVGCTAVWAPACLWLFYQGRTTAAVLLAVYCIVCVSMADNLIKPIVLHGRSNLHPLLALLSVLGGVQALGPIGIFIGPMVVVFLHALLNMLHTELDAMDEPHPPGPMPS